MYISEKISSPMEARVVAFVDVLGFRDLVQELQANDHERLQTVREVLEWIEAQKDFLTLLDDPRTPTGPLVELSQFSYSLILSGLGIAAATYVVASVAGLAHIY